MDHKDTKIWDIKKSEKKSNNKMANSNWTISLITLNMSELNIPIKSDNVTMDLKKVQCTDAFSNKVTFNTFQTNSQKQLPWNVISRIYTGRCLKLVLFNFLNNEDSTRI